MLGHHAAPSARRVDREAGVMEQLREMALTAYDRIIGLELAEVTVDCSALPRLLAAARRRALSPLDRGKQGTKRSTVVDARGIPLGTVAAPANRHDSPLLVETLEALGELGGLPEQVRGCISIAATILRPPASA